MKRILLLTGVILIAVMSLFAENGRVTGRIVDADGQPVPGANVIVKGTSTGTITDANGFYNLPSLESGSYTIEIRYIGYETIAQEVNVTENKTTQTNFVLEPGLSIEGIVVNGRLQGQSKALNTQKNAKNIQNIISAEQIERFPDANIGDALKRLSGINVQYDQGEARFANIRGTAPELNSITINGERIPSAEAEQRYVQLDLVPSDMVQTIELNKALTPDMDADAIGGSVNLVTKSAPYKQTIKIKAGSGFNFLPGTALWKGNASYSNRIFNDKLGIIVGASVLDNPMRSDNIEPEWDYMDDGTPFVKEMQVRQYYVERLRQSYSAALDFKINENHTIYVNGMYNRRKDWENRYRQSIQDIEYDEEAGKYYGEIRREVKGGSSDNNNARLEDQSMMTGAVSGDHYFGKIRVDWRASYAMANEERPNERYLTFRAKDQELIVNLDDPILPSVSAADPLYQTLNSEWSFKELTEEFQYTEEKDMNGTLNVTIPLIEGDYANELKFGVRYRGKDKYRDNDFYEFEPVDEDAFIADAMNSVVDMTNDNFAAGDYQVGEFVSNEFLGALNLESSDFEKEQVAEEMAGNFNAIENVIAGYAMLTQNFGEKFNVIAGVRVENTQLEYQGFKYDADEDELTQTDKENDSYVNILPGVHVNYNVGRFTNIRFAWTNTLARPNYFDLVPYQEVNKEDMEIAIGNPALNPTTAMNFDLLGEHFFKNIGIVSGGIFYKSLKDVIITRTRQDYEYNGEVWDEFYQPVNGGDATLYGFELGFQRRMDFLPGFLDDISLYANYTYNHSELTGVTLEGRDDEMLPLSGTPNHNINASLAYDTKRMDFRISYSHASAFIEEYDEEAFFDRYYDAVNYLDVNATVKINKWLSYYLDINNLLNQPLRYYQGVAERTMQAEYYGIKLQTGIKLKF